MRRLEAKEGQVVATCQVSGWSPSVSEGRVQRGHRGRWSLDRWASFLGFEGLEGESSQSDALSESEVSESEGEGGGGGEGNKGEELGGFVLSRSKCLGRCTTKGTVLEGKGEWKDGLPD